MHWSYYHVQYCPIGNHILRYMRLFFKLCVYYVTSMCFMLLHWLCDHVQSYATYCVFMLIFMYVSRKVHLRRAGTFWNAVHCGCDAMQFIIFLEFPSKSYRLVYCNFVSLLHWNYDHVQHYPASVKLLLIITLLAGGTHTRCTSTFCNTVHGGYDLALRWMRKRGLPSYGRHHNCKRINPGGGHPPLSLGQEVTASSYICPSGDCPLLLLGQEVTANSLSCPSGDGPLLVMGHEVTSCLNTISTAAYTCEALPASGSVGAPSPTPVDGQDGQEGGQEAPTNAPGPRNGAQSGPPACEMHRQAVVYNNRVCYTLPLGQDVDPKGSPQDPKLGPGGSKDGQDAQDGGQEAPTDAPGQRNGAQSGNQVAPPTVANLGPLGWQPLRVISGSTLGSGCGPQRQPTGSKILVKRELATAKRLAALLEKDLGDLCT